MNVVRTFSISEDTEAQISQIAGLQRWNRSVVVEVAINRLHKALVSSPNEFVSISEVQSVADRLLGVTNEAAINPS